MYNFKLDPFLISTKCKTFMWLAMTQKMCGYITFLHDNTWNFPPLKTCLLVFSGSVFASRFKNAMQW
jgi:hypothetical protein